MAGIKPLRKIQLGKEATPGTPVPATTIWRGMGTIDDQREVKIVQEDVGLLTPSSRSYTSKLLGAIDFDDVEFTFEQFPHILEACLLGGQTPAADGTGTDKIWTYPYPTTAIPTLKHYTIEGGDNQQAERIEYGYVDSFGLSGKSQEAIMMKASWYGRQVSKNAFTAALTVPSVAQCMFGAAKLYIDPAVFGTTLKSLTLMAFELSVKTGITPAFPSDNLYYSFVKRNYPEVTLKVTFEHDGTAVAEKDAWIAETDRCIQIKAEGPAVQTPGTLYQKKTVLINTAGKWTKFDKIGEQDGNDIVQGTLTGGYVAGVTGMGSIVVVNELTTLP